MKTKMTTELIKEKARIGKNVLKLLKSLYGCNDIDALKIAIQLKLNPNDDKPPRVIKII
jgi:hypothetical protein